MIRGTSVIDRISKLMTFGGGGLAAGSGYAQGGAPIATQALTLADVSMIVGCIAGAIGAAVQVWLWWARRDSKRWEDELTAARIAFERAREVREQELHHARMQAKDYDRRHHDEP